MKNIKIWFVGLSACLSCGSLVGSVNQGRSSRPQNPAGRPVRRPNLERRLMVRDPNTFKVYSLVSQERAKFILEKYLKEVENALCRHQLEQFLKEKSELERSLLYQLGIVTIWKGEPVINGIAWNRFYAKMPLPERLKRKIKRVAELLENYEDPLAPQTDIKEVLQNFRDNADTQAGFGELSVILQDWMPMLKMDQKDKPDYTAKRLRKLMESSCFPAVLMRTGGVLMELESEMVGWKKQDDKIKFYFKYYRKYIENFLLKGGSVPMKPFVSEEQQ